MENYTSHPLYQKIQESIDHQAEISFTERKLNSILREETELVSQPNFTVNDTEFHPRWFIELTTTCDLDDQLEVALEDYLDYLAEGGDYSPVTLVEKLPDALVKWLIDNNETTNYLLLMNDEESSFMSDGSPVDNTESYAEYFSFYEPDSVSITEKPSVSKLKKLSSGDFNNEELSKISSGILNLIRQARNSFSEIRKIIELPYSITTTQDLTITIPETHDHDIIQTVISQAEMTGNQIIASNLIIRLNYLISELTQPVTHERRRVQTLIHSHMKFIKWSHKYIKTIVNLRAKHTISEAIGSFLIYLSQARESSRQYFKGIKGLNTSVQMNDHLTPCFDIRPLPFGQEVNYSWVYDFNRNSNEVEHNFKSLKCFKINTRILKCKGRDNTIHASLHKEFTVHFT